MEVHEHHETVGLNNFERSYFKKHFGDNIARLRRFRKIIAKEQKSGIYRGEVGTFRSFPVKGKEYMSIWLSRKKVDAYIREISNKE